MKNEFFVNKKELDQEWIDLILAALDLGMTVQEIKDYFSKQTLQVDAI
jgi:DNA-binding transcriptional MerR regulator